MKTKWILSRSTCFGCDASKKMLRIDWHFSADLFLYLHMWFWRLFMFKRWLNLSKHQESLEIQGNKPSNQVREPSANISIVRALLQSFDVYTNAYAQQTARLHGIFLKFVNRMHVRTYVQLNRKSFIINFSFSLLTIFHKITTTKKVTPTKSRANKFLFGKNFLSCTIFDIFLCLPKTKQK